MRPAHSIRKYSVAVVFILTVVVIASRHVAEKAPTQKRYFVTRVIDGDTIVLANNDRVRYIGINTPEIHHPTKEVEWMGNEAKEFNEGLVGARWVTLEFDIEERDRYGRLLAYVYVGDTFVNAELVRRGFAQVYTVPPNVRYADDLLRLEREARASHAGLWSER